MTTQAQNSSSRMAWFSLSLATLALIFVVACGQSKDDKCKMELAFLKSHFSDGTKASLEACHYYSTAWQKAIDNGYPTVEEAIQKVRGDILTKIRIDATDMDADDSKLWASKACEHCSEQEKTLALEAVGIQSELDELARNPKGSLITFNKAVEDLESRMTRCKTQLEVLTGKN